MTLTYKEKIIKAIELAENLDQLRYIEEKIKVTPEINRRTLKGRELTEELLKLSNQKAHKLIDEGEVPFN